MSDVDATRWLTDIRDGVRNVAGPSWVDDAMAEWARHAGNELVQVTVHGAYDVGKSSLLKRFLVEDGTAVPPWLIIGARPTTFTVNRVDSGGLTWVDTPGTDTRDKRHDALAVEALTLTDAVLVVLSPQLFSGDMRHVVGLIDSTFYNSLAQVRLFPTGALVLVVTLMDAAGVSPEDDLDGYRNLVEGKRSELFAALGDAAAAAEPPLVHFVAADPRQVGLLAKPESADYAGTEDWDGVAGLRRDLQTLSGRCAELRAAAEVRFWSRVGERARQTALDEAEHLAEVMAEAVRQEQRVSLWKQELTGIDAAARTKLQEMIYNEITAATTRRVADTVAGRAHIEDQVAATIATWLTEHGARLDQLVRRASAEQQVQMERPGASALRRYLDELFDASVLIGAGQDDTSVDRLIGQFDAHAKSVARAGYKLLHGMSVEEARSELSHLRHLDAEHVTSYFSRGGSALTSAEQAEAMRIDLRRLEVIEDLLPVIADFASFFAAEHQGRLAEQRRHQLNHELRQLADRITVRVLHGDKDLRTWADAVGSVRDALDDLKPDGTTLAEAGARKRQLTVIADRLATLLAEPPDVRLAAPVPSHP